MGAQTVVHGAGPEPAAAVAFSLVEAVARVLVRPCDPFDAAGDEIVESDARGEGDDEPAFLAQRKAADALRHLPALHRLGRRGIALQQLALDIDPIEGLLRHIPDRHLAELVAAIDNAFDPIRSSCFPSCSDVSRSPQA